MTKKFYEGRRLTLYLSDDVQVEDGTTVKGIIIAMPNFHLYLDLESTSELVRGLNQNSYQIYQTRNEIFQ